MTDHSRQHDILQRGQFRQKKVALENKTHLLVAEPGKRRFAAAIELLAFKFHLAGFRPLETGESVKQGRFPRARGAAEKDRLAVLHLEGYPPQDLDPAPADLEGAALDPVLWVVDVMASGAACLLTKRKQDWRPSGFARSYQRAVVYRYNKNPARTEAAPAPCYYQVFVFK